MKPYKVDETAEKILEIISNDAKASPRDIARQISMPEQTVIRCIKKLEKDRIILGYRASVNWQRIRQHEVRALIEVKVSPERGVGFDHVAELIYRFPEVSSLTLLSGAYDLLVQIEGENLREVAQFVSEKLATIKGVMSTATHFMLKKYKEDGIVLVDQADSKRLPLSL